VASGFSRKNVKLIDHTQPFVVLTDLQELGNRVALRAKMRVVGGMLHETCAYRICDDAANGERDLAIIPYHALEAITLPGLLLMAPSEVKAGVRFGRFDERLAIRAVAKTVDEKMDVVQA